MKYFNKVHQNFLAVMTWAGLVIVTLLLATPAIAKNPYTQADRTWISLSGTVESVTADSFLLDYGEGAIIVEMDDGDRDADGYKLIAGDEVTVNGMIDDDFYQVTTIEASSVYVEKLGTSFFASAMDEEDSPITIVTPIIYPSVAVQGTVTNVFDTEFTINAGLRSLTVEVHEMPYNPLDDKGFQKVNVGDVVLVTGTIERDLFEGREMVAKTLIVLK